MALAALGFGALLGGCGDDEEPEVTLPTISVESSVESTTEQTQTSPGQTTTEKPQTGGTPPSYDPGAEDSPSNDKPPDPGSPEEAFENHCKQNPGACG